MAVEFHCPVCSGTLRVGDGPVGRLVRCGGCLTALKVPDAPPLDPQDDATTDALHTRIELLPVAHPVTSQPPIPPPSAPKRTRPAPQQPEEPESTGRGKTFWLSLSFLTLAIGMCGCCGFAALLIPPPTWQPYESRENGGFKVDLPADPQPDMANRVRSAKEGREHKGVEGTFLWTRSETFIVAYRDLDRLPKSEDAFLDDEVEVITSDATVVKPILRSDHITVQEFPGREFEYQFKNGGVITGRTILAGKRVYVLVAGGQFSRTGNENARRFLESFEITDPKLLALAKQRADAAKKKDDPKKKVPRVDPRDE